MLLASPFSPFLEKRSSVSRTELKTCMPFYNFQNEETTRNFQKNKLFFIKRQKHETFDFVNEF